MVKKIIKALFLTMLIFIIQRSLSDISRIVIKDELFSETAVALTVITFLIIRKREWLKNLFISNESVNFSKYELIFSFFIRVSLFLGTIAYYVNNHSFKIVREQLYGFDVNRYSLITIIVILLFTGFYYSIVYGGFYFNTLRKGLNPIISVCIVVLIASSGREGILPKLLIFYNLGHVMYLQYKSKDVRLGTFVGQMSNMTFLANAYLFKNNFDESWTLVSTAIIFIIEFLLLTVLYDKFVAHRFYSDEEFIIEKEA